MIAAPALSHDLTKLAVLSSSSARAALLVYDLRSGDLLAETETPWSQEGAFALAWSPDDRVVAVFASVDGSPAVSFHAPGGAEVGRIQFEPRGPTETDFVPKHSAVWLDDERLAVFLPGRVVVVSSSGERLSETSIEEIPSAGEPWAIIRVDGDRIVLRGRVEIEGEIALTCFNVDLAAEDVSGEPVDCDLPPSRCDPPRDAHLVLRAGEASVFEDKPPVFEPGLCTRATFIEREEHYELRIEVIEGDEVVETLEFGRVIPVTPGQLPSPISIDYAVRVAP